MGHRKVGKKRSLLKMDLPAGLIFVKMLPRELRVLNMFLHFLDLLKHLKQPCLMFLEASWDYFEAAYATCEGIGLE